jgi:hypothetical protein
MGKEIQKTIDKDKFKISPDISLLSLIKSFSKIEDEFPDVDENLQPLDDVEI